MLPAKYRFHSRGGVNYTYRHGRTIRGPLLSLVYVKNTRQKTRFAVVVSKKVQKRAVDRNRIRRRIYEAVRLEMPSLKIPTDYIFIVHSKELQKIDFQKLCGLIKDLFLKTGSLTEHS